MKKIIFISVIISAAVYFFSSCERESSADVSQDRIYVSYEMVYHESTDITYARASFFFGSITGTKLELSDPSQVTCNGDLLGFQNALAYYEKQYTGFVNVGQYIFSDTDGLTFTNSVTITEIGLSSTVDTIVKGSSYELFFTGDPLSAGEGVYAEIDGTGESDNISVYQNTSNATSIIIPANQTDKLTVGTNTVYLRKRHETDAQEASSAGANCAGIYQTEEVNFEVVE